MCRIHHLTCPHCLRALLITRRCDDLIQRRATFEDPGHKPEYVDCAYFQLVSRIVRGYKRETGVRGELELETQKGDGQGCHFCFGRVWYVLPTDGEHEGGWKGEG